MSTASKVLRDVIVDAFRNEEVALQAGVDYDTWASTTAPRVFIGQAGYIGARNRGRLPFVEVVVESQSFVNQTGQGGTLRSRASIRVYDTGRDHEEVANRMEAIMASGIAEVRNNRLDNYTELGDSEIDSVKPGPMGWVLDASMTFEFSYDRESHEISE